MSLQTPVGILLSSHCRFAPIPPAFSFNSFEVHALQIFHPLSVRGSHLQAPVSLLPSYLPL
uniref:Uncharacterized protein n=1 Tax=Xenopus tropicalis TaxID=8364 RepID=A0A803JZB7_XENTR